MWNQSLIATAAGVLLVGTLAAEVEVPGGKGMSTHTTGGAVGGVGITTTNGNADSKVTYTTHVVLADTRQWTSTDGKTLQAKMIGFDDIVVETPKGAAQPPPPAPPANVTVVRGGKIRLVATQKPFELALDRLSQADREFVERIRAAHANKPPPPAP
jgi:hypothetical protein